MHDKGIIVAISFQQFIVKSTQLNFFMFKFPLLARH